MDPRLEEPVFDPAVERALDQLEEGMRRVAGERGIRTPRRRLARERWGGPEMVHGWTAMEGTRRIHRHVTARFLDGDRMRVGIGANARVSTPWRVRWQSVGEEELALPLDGEELVAALRDRYARVCALRSGDLSREHRYSPAEWLAADNVVAGAVTIAALLGLYALLTD
ncbi:MAG: hypothetical protein M3N16_06890 [Actinomycetota bacterium]|nr:hypothetical protein [Actinomycetota bacterium]